MKAKDKQLLQHRIALTVDVLMIILVILDVSWIIFDGLMEMSIFS